MFYCIKCQKVHKDSEASVVFSTGYRRLDGVDYHLGRCRIQVIHTPKDPMGENASFREAANI